MHIFIAHLYSVSVRTREHMQKHHYVSHHNQSTSNTFDTNPCSIDILIDTDVDIFGETFVLTFILNMLLAFPGLYIDISIYKSIDI